MKLLDRYVLREFLGYVLLGLSGFIVIFIVVDVFEKISVFLDHRAPLATVARFYVNLTPQVVVQVLPVALLQEPAETRRAVVIDAPEGCDAIKPALDGLQVQSVIVTHRHRDHWAGIESMLSFVDAPVVGRAHGRAWRAAIQEDTWS